MILGKRATTTTRREVSAALVVALLLFGQTCALRGGVACAAPFPSGESYSTVSCDGDCADHDGDGDDCGGCEHGTPTGCSHGSMCCSTWSLPTATVTVPAPPAISCAFLTGPSFEPISSFSPQLVPI